MLPTKPLTDVLKTATEVTSLSSYDCLAFIANDGTPKKYPKNRFDMNYYRYFQTQSSYGGKWLRIAKIEHNTAAIIYASNKYNNSAPSGLIFAVTGAIHTHPYFSVAPIISTFWGSKVRFVYGPNSDYYLELYIAPGFPRNEMHFMISGMNISFVDKIEEGSVPSGCNSKEFSLVSSITSVGEVVSVSGGG